MTQALKERIQALELAWGCCIEQGANKCANCPFVNTENCTKEILVTAITVTNVFVTMGMFDNKKALFDFKEKLIDNFLALSDYNDFYKVTLVKIGDMIEATFDEEIKKLEMEN